jgi:hypothetical protein
VDLVIRVATACLLFATGAAHAQNVDSSTFKSIYAARDVSLSTSPQSEFWREAKPIYIDVDIDGNPQPRYKTTVRSRWTNENLYVFFECPYDELYLKPDPDTVAETNQLWKWDVAEIFLGSDFQNIRRYKEFELSPQGEWIDLDIDLSLPHHESGWTWKSGFKVAARIDRKAKIWYGAMRIPFAALDQRTPAAGNIFRANLFRVQGPPDRQHQVAWKAPMAETFHKPERFGELELVKDR